MRVRIIVAVLCLLTATSACRRSVERRTVMVATTPDVAATGIVERLTAAFAAQRQTATEIVVTEERFIPALIEEHGIDAVITTSPALQEALRRGGDVHLASTFAYEEFIIAGPPADPARVREAPTPAEAFRRIARRDRAFCSPVDVPVLREREAMIWSSSRAKPSDDRRYRACKGSAVKVLRESSRRAGYTITHPATLDAVRSEVKLESLMRGEAPLVDAYTVILTENPSRNRNALWFVQWVMSVRGRDVITAHRFEDQRRFYVRAAT